MTNADPPKKSTLCLDNSNINAIMLPYFDNNSSETPTALSQVEIH